ncbi:MAG TPA: lysophospholipid acyltransferase family protein [Burkholderiales bacterium]|nr:lysophospholipid acyltransferase family protein [Burkholderiales bacterium]
MAAHLARGLAITALRFPGLPWEGRRTEIRRWSRELLTIMGVQVRQIHHPDALPERCMLVTNHISWLDVFVLLATHPGIFVAKSEIRGWPLAGRLCAAVGTLFIERGNRAAVRHVNRAMVEAMRDHVIVSVYPEGTTTDGRSLHKFHAALFQPAIDAGATLVPVALRYTNRAGGHCEAIEFVGETTFVESLWRTSAEKVIVAELTWLPGEPGAGADRRHLAEVMHQRIAQALGVPSVQHHYVSRG